MASLVWFRNDLRLGDNPAAAAAAARGAPVAGLFVLEAASAGGRTHGAAAAWKLHGALAKLAQDLADRGAPLILRKGDPRAVVPAVSAEVRAQAVMWNRRYEAAAVATDTAVKADLKDRGVAAESFGGNLLVEPWEVESTGGRNYRVFTPFYKAARKINKDLTPIPKPHVFAKWTTNPDLGDDLTAWGLRPTAPDWAGGLREAWDHGETAAKGRLASFVDDGLAGYRAGRDVPAAANVSRLSPYLRFGELGPRQARQAAATAAAQANGALDGDFEAFERELYWRDFSYNLLFNGDDLAAANVQSKFDAFPWRDDPDGLKAWRRGRTGYPVVDAGMRQLWRTGWMHNRVRMVVASFLTKHLMIDWRQGERWFWDTLVDADPASNPANWQWVAGCGADAAPYFRIFNPVAQGEKFDPDGAYVRRWVPELKDLPAKYVHAPWTAPADALATAGVVLDRDYPTPIVDHKAARERALAAFKGL